MYKDTAATEKGACTPPSRVLPTDFETPREGSCDSSGESTPPDSHDQFKTFSSAQPPNPTQQTQEK